MLADPDRDILKVAVIERYHGTHHVGIGFVQGFGFRDGAIASTVAHDSHDLIVIGTDDASMMLAINKIIEMQGGLGGAIKKNRGTSGKSFHASQFSRAAGYFRVKNHG